MFQCAIGAVDSSYICMPLNICKKNYFIYLKAYVSRIYSPNCTLKQWIALEIWNSLHKIATHATPIDIKACMDSDQCQREHISTFALVFEFGTSGVRIADHS